jgi:hypothetical protein
MRFWFSRNRDGTSKAKSSRAGRPYDVAKWRDVIKHDEGIAAIVENLQPLGDKWVDEFARNYLTLNDRKSTWRIVQKVIDDARLERGQTGA